MHPNYVRIGGLNGDLPDGFLAQLDALIAKFPAPHARAARAAAGESDLPRPHDRRRHLSRRRSDRSGTSPARRCAAAASPTTCAKPFRTAATSSTSSTSRRAPKATPTRASSCGSTRWTQSMRIIEQARKRLDTPGPVMIDDPKFVAPPKETIALSMEALIHHFKIVSEGFRVPPGDVYQAIEGRRAASWATTSSATATTARTACARARRQHVQPASAQGHAPSATSSPTWS